MRNISALLMILFLANFVGINTATAQDQDTTKVRQHVVYMNDGTQYIGEIIKDDGREVLIMTQSLGKLYLNKMDIKSIKFAEEDELEEWNGEYRTKSPFNTRYFFTTTGHSLKKGDNYAMIHLYGPELHFSVTDRFSLGVMTTWIASPFVGAAKYSIPTSNKNLNFSLGVLVGTSGYLNDFRGYGGLGFGTMTLGSREKNISFSAGFARLNMGEEDEYFDVPGLYTINPPTWNYYDDPVPKVKHRNKDITAPAFSVAGMLPMGKKATFIFDSMVFLGKREVEERETEVFYNDQNQTEAILVTGGTEIRRNVALYLMPGVRVQETENRAIQISVAGFTQFTKDDVNTFPLPMVTWFLNF